MKIDDIEKSVCDIECELNSLKLRVDRLERYKKVLVEVEKNLRLAIHIDDPKTSNIGIIAKCLNLIRKEL